MTINKVKILEIVDENHKVKSFILDVKLDAKPGQFVMVSITDVDEKPFTLSCLNPVTVTVEKKGLFTEVMFKLKVGDKVGVRGPYGNGFTLNQKSCIVAGGLGIAPLLPIAGEVSKVIVGAKSEDDLIFMDKLGSAVVCTDDGSAGKKGFTTDILKELLKTEKFGVVYTCGPEIMMKKVFEICEEQGIECQASLERYMRCGFGVCGACVCGDQMVCKDGPVFSSEQLRMLNSFGESALLKSGKEVKLKEYYSYREK
jgi:dihydroorotate dehydrogenase electron transfer subunit